MIRGEVHIRVEGSEAVDLGPGDLASFPKGQHATWTIRSPFTKFFVSSG